MKIRIAVLLVLFFAIFVFAQAQTDSSKIADTTKIAAVHSVEKFDPNADPVKDVQAAVAEAKKHNKRILLDVGGEWCIWCHRLDTLFMQNPDLAEFMHKNFVVVKVNVSKENKNEKFLAQYPEVPGYPHIFILEKDGKLLHSQNTGDLESGKHHDPEKVRAFLKEWAPPKETPQHRF